MKKTNFKNFLVILFTLVMVFVLTLAFVACNDSNTQKTEPEKETEKTTDTSIIKNGNFATYTGSSAPYVAGTWKTSSSSSIKTNFKGVVHVDDLFAAESASTSWSNISNPGKANADDKDSLVYMIYNVKEDTSTVYQSFTTAIGGYYKISVDFKVVGGVEELKDGVYITFSGNVYQKFGPFTPSENNEWKTAVLYVESSFVESQSITVTMSLGDSQASTKATGCAFFDNVVAEKIQKSDYEAAKTAHNSPDLSAASESKELTAFYSMLTPDGDFLNNMSVANPATPNTWTKTVGKDNTGTTLTTNYLSSGVVNVDEFEDWKTLVGEKEDEANVAPKTPYQYISDKGTLDTFDYDLSKDSKVLLITNYPAIAKAQSNSSAYTAVGYTAKSSMAVELGTYYELKVWVYTDLVNFDYEAENKVSTDPIDFGARIVVTGVGDQNYFQDINTNKQWVEYTFAIIGHEYRTKSIGLELWLGNGVEGENNLACGTVLFDNVRLIKRGTLTDSTRDSILDQYNNVAQANPSTYKVIDIKSLSDSSMIENTIKNPNFNTVDEKGLPTDWNLSIVNDVNAEIQTGNDKKENPDIIVDVINTKNEQAHIDAQQLTEEQIKKYWQDNYGIDANPNAPYETLDNILMINNVSASAYQMKLPASFEVLPNLQYRLGLWIKTVGIKEGTGATITLMNETDDSAMATFKTVNTANYENEITNGYAEYVFYVQGSNFISSDLNGDKVTANLTLKMGDGNAFDSSAFVSGAIFIANVNLEQVTYDEYKKASSSSNDYVKTKSLATSQGTVSNGSFNSFEYDEDKIDPVTGLQTDFLKPSNWTLNSGLNKDDVKTGVVNTNHTAFVNSTFGSGYNIYTAFASGDITKPIDFGKPNVLAINVINPIKSSLVYSSSSISLSKESYYIFKLYGMVDGVKAQVALEANNNTVPMYYTLGDHNGLWEEMVFVVKTGSLAAPSITIKLYVGDYKTDNETKYEEGNEPKYSGKIFFDSFTYYTIDSARYEELAATVGNSSYTVDTFNTTAKPTTVTGPSSSMWTGSGEKNSSSSNRANEENMQYAGIIVKGSSEPDTFKKTEDVKVKDPESGEEKTEVQTIEGTVLTNEQIWVNDDTAFIMINNQKASYYSYKNKSSISLDAKSYYKLTIDARTLGIKEGEYAIVKVENSNDTFEIKVNTEYAPKLDANGKIVYDNDGKIVYEKTASSDWTTYTFYFKTAESSKMSSVYVSMILGKSDAKVQGTAFFDNVSLTKLDNDTEFKTAYASIYKVDEDGNALVDEDGKYIEAENADKYLLTNRVIRADDEKKDEEEKPDDEANPDKGNNLTWLYISSIVIAAVMIVVIAVWLIKKYVPKNLFKRKKVASYSRKEEKDDKKSNGNKSDNDEFKD